MTMALQTPEQVASSCTWWGSAVAVLSGAFNRAVEYVFGLQLSVSDVSAFGGLMVAFGGLLVNIHFRRQELRLRERELRARGVV